MIARVPEPYAFSGKSFTHTDELVNAYAKVYREGGHNVAVFDINWLADEQETGGEIPGYVMAPYDTQHWQALLTVLNAQRPGIRWLRILEPFRSAFAPNLPPLAQIQPEHRVQNAAELMSKKLPLPKFIIPGLLPEGATFLAGKPKMGKSWLALQVALATAMGGKALGYDVTPGDVLYLALEDNERRLQSRINQQLRTDNGPQALPTRLSYVTDWPRLDEGGLSNMQAWLQEHPDARLLIVDTLAKVKPRQKRNGAGYDDDYDAVAPLQLLAAEYGVAVLIVHHLRKMGSDDPLDLISGTLGLAGGVDGAWILRRERGKADASLFVTGRDVADETELALQFDRTFGTWSVIGDAQTCRLSNERTEVLRVLKEAGQPLKPAEIALRLGVPAATMRKRLFDMYRAQEVVERNGRYSCA